MAEPWGIYVDVEGFRSFVDTEQLRAMHALGDLRVTIFRAGRRWTDRALVRVHETARPELGRPHGAVATYRRVGRGRS